MNTCQIQQTSKTLKFVPANNSSLKVYYPLQKQTKQTSTKMVMALMNCSGLILLLGFYLGAPPPLFYETHRHVDVVWVSNTEVGFYVCVGVKTNIPPLPCFLPPPGRIK